MSYFLFCLYTWMWFLVIVRSFLGGKLNHLIVFYHLIRIVNSYFWCADVTKEGSPCCNAETSFCRHYFESSEEGTTWSCKFCKDIFWVFCWEYYVIWYQIACCLLSDNISCLVIQCDKTDPVKLQQEKERLERRQREGDLWSFTLIVVMLHYWSFLFFSISHFILSANKEKVF